MNFNNKLCDLCSREFIRLNIEVIDKFCLFICIGGVENHRKKLLTDLMVLSCNSLVFFPINFSLVLRSNRIFEINV